MPSIADIPQLMKVSWGSTCSCDDRVAGTEVIVDDFDGMQLIHHLARMLHEDFGCKQLLPRLFGICDFLQIRFVGTNSRFGRCRS